ncbi:hypothetical protein [Nocardia sp.]|uniref:hypothetical protein n=1 Tax=Nocardia sp. TaxID=1821 RepID=UPI00258433ED|nr:hypothetical protein [Nocardia sp.]
MGGPRKRVVMAGIGRLQDEFFDAPVIFDTDTPSSPAASGFGMRGGRNLSHRRA